MIQEFHDLPEGVLGFMITDEVTRSDYDDVLMPPIRELVKRGGKVRAVCQFGPDFHGYDKDAHWEDVKAGSEWGIGPHDSWDRIAVLTDERKIRKAVKLFGWLAPGEAKLFRVSEFDEAVAWAASGDN